MKNYFYLILKALFALKIFKFLSWFFGHAEKMAWLDILGWFQNLSCYNLVKKLLQYTYCPIFHEGKAIRQSSLVSWENIKRKIFYLKNLAENEARGLDPDFFLFFKKAWNELKVSVLQLCFSISW